MMIILKYCLRSMLLIAIGLSWIPVVWGGLNDGLVAYYPFNGNANDKSGNGNHGTVHGATLTTDRFGNNDSSYSFDGNSYIDVGNGIHPRHFTVSAWINPFLITSERHSIVSSREAGSGSPGINEGFVLALPEGTNGKARIWAKVGSWKHATDNVVLKSSWTFLVGTFDGQTLRLFRNGVVVAENSVTGSFNTTPERTIIGARASFDKYFFQGIIDDVRIYNRALSDSEIQQLYQTNNQPVEPSSDDCWATYENGKLHIPCIKLKGALGEELHYEVDMQYKPLSQPMSFQLTGAKPK